MSIYDELFQSSGKPGSGESVFSGIVTGIVKENYNKDFPGMLRVEIRTREKDSNVTHWAKIVSPYGGDERGIYFLPEVGDEVVIAYLHGDIHRPYVIGCVWNQKNSKMPKDVAVEKNYIKKIRTKRGHEIIFNEEENKDDLEIHTPKELKVKLNDEKEVIFIQDKDGKNIIKIDAKNGAINIKADKKIVLESGSSKITIDGSGNKIAIAGNTVQIEGKQALNLKGQTAKMEGTNTEISGSAGTTIKGATVKIN